jgi:hypothetical protein
MAEGFSVVENRKAGVFPASQGWRDVFNVELLSSPQQQSPSERILVRSCRLSIRKPLNYSQAVINGPKVHANALPRSEKSIVEDLASPFFYRYRSKHTLARIQRLTLCASSWAGKGVDTAERLRSQDHYSSQDRPPFFLVCRFVFFCDFRFSLVTRVRVAKAFRRF